MTRMKNIFSNIRKQMHRVISVRSDQKHVPHVENVNENIAQIGTDFMEDINNQWVYFELGSHQSAMYTSLACFLI